MKRSVGEVGDREFGVERGALVVVAQPLEEPFVLRDARRPVAAGGAANSASFGVVAPLPPAA
ncbi:MAG: hypothetical protein U1F49_05670 [Rubrivivax sp.]